jgi:hypothetical protein
MQFGTAKPFGGIGVLRNHIDEYAILIWPELHGFHLACSELSCWIIIRTASEYQYGGG